MLALVLAVPASAQAFTVLDEDVIVAPLRAPNGVGAPSVAWDGSRYVMYFETRDVRPARRCAESWSVGWATSTDGLAWTVQRTRALTHGAGYECGARHPAYVRHDDGTSALFFQALTTTADDGVGVVTDLGGVDVTRILPELVGLYEPAAARVDGEWAVVGVDATGLRLARSTDLVTFTFDPAPEIATGAVPWGADGLSMPTLGCIDATAFPWQLYLGGWTGTETAWAPAAGATTGAWYVGASLETWTDDSAWAAVDFVTDGTGTRVYFETTGAGGLPRIGVAESGGAPATSALRDRDCQ